MRAIEGRGIGVVAARALPAGTLIHDDVPLLAASIGADTACYHCLRPLPPAKDRVACACDRHYCSAGCKAVALDMYHAPLCGAADGKAVAKLEAQASAGFSASSRFILLAWKMLGAALVQAKRTGMPLQAPPDVAPFCHLARVTDWASADARPAALRFTALYPLRMWILVRELLGSETTGAEPALSMAWVRDVVALLSPNVMGLHGSGRMSVATCGQVLMGAGSFFNHSCVPNTAGVSNVDMMGATVRFVTTRPVAAGEELTIAYCHTDVPLEARRTTLEVQYGFTCACPKCAAEA